VDFANDPHLLLLLLLLVLLLHIAAASLAAQPAAQTAAVQQCYAARPAPRFPPDAHPAQLFAAAAAAAATMHAVPASRVIIPASWHCSAPTILKAASTLL
jgi:hypothetical protein